jgi:hypothetical protein
MTSMSTDAPTPRHAAARGGDDLGGGSRTERVLKAIGLVLLGAALAAAGLISWYHWGRSTAPTSIAITYTKNGGSGMNPTRCEVNASQNEALAYGTFTGPASANGNNIALYVVGAHGELLGSTDQNNTDVSAGADWTLQAHLLQGFGPPTACYVSSS